MALVEVQTDSGPRKVHVCDGCKAACIPWPMRFCSGHCRRNFDERERINSFSRMTDYRISEEAHS